MKLTDGVYGYVWSGQGNGCNSYAIRYDVNGQQRYLVVDPGQRRVLAPALQPMRGGMASYVEEPALDILLGQMARDGIAPEEIGLIVCTHCHPDHCEAALQLKLQRGAPVAVHENEREAFVRVSTESYGGSNGKPSVEMEPDIFLDEGELLLGTPNPLSLRIIHTPGHSSGSISIYWPEKRALIAGDVVFYRNVGRTDFPGGDARTLRESVSKLAELDVEYLLTGHPYQHPGVIVGKREVETNFRYVLLSVLRF